MKFGKILSKLQKGEVVRRKVFNSNIVIFMQTPPKMSVDEILITDSIPDLMKILMYSYNAGIKYTNLFMIYDFSDNTCASYSFTSKDMLAKDWEVVTPLTYNPYANC